MQLKRTLAGVAVTAYADLADRPHYYEWHDEHRAVAGVEFWNDPTAPTVTKWAVDRGFNSPRIHAVLTPLMWGLGGTIDRRRGYGWHLRLAVQLGPLELEFTL